MEDIKGITLPYFAYPARGGGDGVDSADANPFVLSLFPPGMDTNSLEVFDVNDVNAVQSTTPTRPLSALTTPRLSTTADEHVSGRCQQYLPILLLALAASGFVFNAAAYILTTVRSKSNRHHHNFLHIFLSNILLLLPIPFVINARLEGMEREWTFGVKCKQYDKSYLQALSVISATAGVACAFQLTDLAVTRCAEVVSYVLKPTVSWRKAVCYILWLVAAATAWPAAMYDDPPKGSLPSQTEMPISREAALYKQMIAVIGYVFPCVICIVSFLFAIFCKNDRSCQDIKKKLPNNLYGMKEAVFHCTLFFLFWLPYQAWTLHTLTTASVSSGCSVIQDGLLCVGISYCTIMAIAHIICRARAENSSQMNESSTDAENELLDSNSNTTKSPTVTAV